MHANGARPHLIAPAASPEEAAAIVAAVQQFMRATAAPSQPLAPGPSPWQRAAMLEAVERAPGEDAREPWINT
jgi:hypothetical protein